MAQTAINDPFSTFGASSKVRLLMLGEPSPETDLVIRARSLHIEHVSPPDLPGGISHPPSSRSAGPRRTEASTLAHMRKWFFGRKPDAGFLLTGFPATLLQAKVFDEWLEARGENLHAVLAGKGASGPLVDHYRDLGLLAGSLSSFLPSSGTARS